VAKQGIPAEKQRRAKFSLGKMMEILEPFLPEPEKIKEAPHKHWRLPDDHCPVPPPNGTHCESI